MTPSSDHPADIGVGWWTPDTTSINPTATNPFLSSSNHGAGATCAAETADRDELTRRHASRLAAVIELVSLINGCDSLSDAASEVAGAIRDWFSAARVDLYWQSGPARPAAHLAHAGLAGEASDQTRASREAAAEETLSRSCVADSHAIIKRDQFATLALRRHVESTPPKRVFALPLSPTIGLDEPVCCGAILIRFDAPVPENDAREIRDALTAAREPIFMALRNIHRNQRSRWMRMLCPSPNSWARWKRTLVLVHS